MCEFCNGSMNSEVIKSEITNDIMYLDGSYLITDLSRRKSKEALPNSTFKARFCLMCGKEL